MGNAHYFVGLVAFIILVGLVLRYGKSSNALAQDINAFVSTLTLQGPNVKYYGP